MAESSGLSELQLDVMRSLWARGEATSAEVHQDLAPTRGLAPTTVATMLRRMETKGVVTHDTVGRQFVYRAVVSEADVRRGMVSDLTRRLFRGDPAALVNHLITEGEIDSVELDRLRTRIADHESKERADG